MLRRTLQLRSARLALTLLFGILLLAVVGPFAAPYPPLAGSAEVLAHPSAQHWLGTDYLGRDVLSRILAGSPVSVLGAVLVAVIALLLGSVPGILSVYLGARFEWLSLRFFDTLLALPFLLFAVSMTALLGNGLMQAMTTVGILVAPAFYRVSRAATLSVARSEYVEAARLSGASTSWIVRRHVLAKVLPPIAISLATTMGNGLVVVASLTFLGIGVQPPEATWGGILASDLTYLSYRPYAPLFPTVLIMATVWALNLLADAIRDVAGESGRQLVERLEGNVARARPAEAVRSGATLAPGAGEVVLSLKDAAVASQLDGHAIVHGVTVSLRRGQVIGIVGESGSGKTLTCKALLGILPRPLVLSGGSIELAGRDIAGFNRKDWRAARGRVITAVFQDPGSYLNPAIRVGAQLAEQLRVHQKLTRRAARTAVVSLFETVQLREPEILFDQYPHELSGGMLQRVLIASAIALGPQILIADEATTALDVTVQAEILDLLLDLKRSKGLSLIVVSHDLAVIGRLCDEVLVMRAGHVVEQGPAAEILYRPGHEYTRRLVAEQGGLLPGEPLPGEPLPGEPLPGEPLPGGQQHHAQRQGTRWPSEGRRGARAEPPSGDRPEAGEVLEHAR